MARKLTPETIARIQARKREGLSHDQLAGEFGISRGSITNALKAVSPNPPTATPGGGADAFAGSEPDGESSPSSEAPGEPVTLEEIRIRLGEITRHLGAAAEKARNKGETGVYLQLARAATMAMKELGRFTPPPAPDLNEHPDMVAAAARAREALHELIERELGKAEP